MAHHSTCHASCHGQGRASYPAMARLRAGIALSSLALSPFATPALAQVAEGSLLPTLYYSVSALPVEAGQTALTATVITADDLARSALRSLPLILAAEAGVSASQRGPMGASAVLRLRGLGGGYIATRLDGIDITDPSEMQTALNFGHLPSLGLSQAEILRGSQSAIHGSEAIGGVVSLATFRPEAEGFSGETRLELGSHESAAAASALGYRQGGTEAALTLSRSLSEGFSSQKGNDEADGFDGRFLSYHLSHEVGGDLTIGVNGHLRKNSTDFDANPLDPVGVEQSQTEGHRLFADLATGAVSHHLSFARTQTRRALTQNHWQAPYAPYTTVLEGQREEARYTAQWDATADVTLNWGLEHSRESYVEESARGGSTTRAAYGEALWTPNDRLDLSLALRHVDHDSFGSHDTWRLAAAYDLAADLTLRATASTGFAAPSPYQLYSRYGQTALLPETSDSYELGLDYTSAAGHKLQATLFDIALRDRIVFVSYPAGEGACADGWGCYDRIAGVTRSQGLELEGAFVMGPDWEIAANYTYTDAATGGQRVALVPQHAINLGVTGQLGTALSANLQIQHIAGLQDAVYSAAVGGSVNVDKPDYTLVHAGASYALNESAALYLQVENLFDTDYETVTQYNQAGRTWRLGLSTQF